jgi:hypothetical protein
MSEPKVFYRDDGTRYRAQEVVVSPELLANDGALAWWVRSSLEEFGAVVIRVLDRTADKSCQVIEDDPEVDAAIAEMDATVAADHQLGCTIVDTDNGVRLSDKSDQQS